MSLYPDHINLDLLNAYLNDELDARQAIIVEGWIDASDENRLEFEALQRLWALSGQILPVPAEVETDKAWEKLVARLDQESVAPPKVILMGKASPARYAFLLKVAAVLLPFLALAYLVSLHFAKPEIQHLITAGLVLTDTLPDGSMVQLNEYSSIRYPKKFRGDTRDVSLEGEAFFQVETDPGKSFRVNAGNVVIKVVGTSFYVHAYPEEDFIEVFVKTGRVIQYHVEHDRILDSLWLEPGMKGVFNRLESSLSREDAVDENQWYWSNNTLKFNKKPLHEVFEVIEEAYKIDIVVLNDSINGYRLTSRFTSLPVEQVMEIIAESFNLSILQEGNSFSVDVESN